ncbi:hypothetical protein RFM68_20780 [Mesorhizobium sp. MSK_1335]|uniref:Uncharacterized protein n=1 Tax=Mesorhizobium montanum TaxID=3072323 RepID=A0ABU4ZNJ7_9HYPH|nr:hypothetical protein [Mesorhizobium sp. MSK_1335]MDX8526941.1 hypothetical protein [Mesorhizobium sp. MSK_1335]
MSVDDGLSNAVFSDLYQSQQGGITNAIEKLYAEYLVLPILDSFHRAFVEE